MSFLGWERGLGDYLKYSPVAEKKFFCGVRKRVEGFEKSNIVLK